MYTIGEYALYRNWRVCVVKGIDTPSFEKNRERVYYTLFPAFDDGNGTTLYVPVDANDSLSPLSAKEALTKALHEVREPTTSLCKKPTQLVAQYDGILANGTVNEYLSLLKWISNKEKSTKKLSKIDIRYRKRLEKVSNKTKR